MQLSHSLILVTECSNMAPHGKELFDDLKRRIVALGEDGQGYKKITNTLKLSCSTVAKIIQRFKRAGSTQNRPRIRRPKKLNTPAEHHIQMLSLKDWRRSAVSIAAEIEEVGISLLVLRPYVALYIKLVCMAVTPGESLFWRRYTRKPSNSLLKTCQQSTWITGTMSYGLMKWRLIHLVLMASSMCGSDQVRSTKISVSYLQSSMVGVMYDLGLHECCRCWRVTFHWGKHELQHVLWNTAAEHDPIPPETGSQSSVTSWQWPQTHLQDDHCFTEEVEGKGDGLAKHVSRFEPNRTSLGDPQAEGGSVLSLKYPPTPWRRHGGVEEHSRGYLRSSVKLHAQQSKGSYG